MYNLDVCGRMSDNGTRLDYVVGFSNLGRVRCIICTARLDRGIDIRRCIFCNVVYLGLPGHNGEQTLHRKHLKIVEIGADIHQLFLLPQHVLHCFVAGIVGDWWFTPRSSEQHLRRGAVAESFLIATVYSFGSICLGSLLVGQTQLLRQIVEQFVPASEIQTFCCLPHLRCAYEGGCLAPVNMLSAYFNPYAFSYIGMYGYDFLTSGNGATNLFFVRGWEGMVKDGLVSNAIMLLELVVGGCTGCLAVIIEAGDRYQFLTSYTSSNSSASAFA